MPYIPACVLKSLVAFFSRPSFCCVFSILEELPLHFPYHAAFLSATGPYVFLTMQSSCWRQVLFLFCCHKCFHFFISAFILLCEIFPQHKILGCILPSIHLSLQHSTPTSSISCSCCELKFWPWLLLHLWWISLKWVCVKLFLDLHFWKTWFVSVCFASFCVFVGLPCAYKILILLKVEK